MTTYRNLVFVGFIALAALAALAVPATTFGQPDPDCDCFEWPWAAECVDFCRNTLSRSISRSADLGDLIENAYGEREFPLDIPMAPDILYTDPARLNWVDVSEFPNKAGAMAVWPSAAGVVISDIRGRVLIQYPNSRYAAPDTAEGVEQPRYLVPQSFLTEQAAQDLEQRPQ